MGAPQIIVIALHALSVVLTGYNHGKPKEGTENVGVAIIGAGIMMALLSWGGFFTGK